MWPLCGHLSHQKEDWESGQLRFNVSTRKWPRRLRKSRSVMSDSLQPHGLYSPRNSPGQNTGVGSLSLLQGIFPTQGSNPGLPHCRQVLLPAEPQGKPKNTGVGSLSLLQRIFPTQKSNRCLLHCRQILYQLSYQGIPEGLEVRSMLRKHSLCPSLDTC